MTFMGQTAEESPRITTKGITAIALIMIALVLVLSDLHDGTISLLGAHSMMTEWIWFLVLLATSVVAGFLCLGLRPRSKK